MSRPRQRSVARGLTAAAGLGALLAAGVLTVDTLVARWNLPQEEALVDSLEGLGQTDATSAPELHAEYERQRDASLGREWRKTAAAWGLVAACAALVASIKWLVTLKERAPNVPKCLRRESPPAGGDDTPGPPASAAADVDVDLSFVEGVVAREGRRPESVIPVLQALQAHYHYLPQPALRRVCELTEISAAQIVGVASFYTQFRRTPVGAHLIKVCHGTACHVGGAPRITDELRRRLRIAPGEDTDPTRKFTVEQVACLGCCTLAPVAQIDGVTHGHLESDTLPEVVAQIDKPKTNGERRRPTRSASLETAAAAGEIRLGLGSCCIANGSADVHVALQQALVKTGVNATVKRVGCVGMCHQTPFIEVDVNGQSARYGRVQPEHATAIVRRHFKSGGLGRRLRNAAAQTIDRLRDGAARRIVTQHALKPRDPLVAAFLGPQKHIATEHYGCLDPTDLDEYLRHDGFQALEHCRRELAPDEVIAQIRRSGLRGRGGAGFPTAEKWSKVRQAPGAPKYVICNGDEGDPGAFMDRMLMESYPYRVIEGMSIAAHAAGASEGILFIRREYPLAAERVRDALRQCEQRGLLGAEAGSSPGLRLRVVEGAGAFVCGEESALIATLQGRRGMPSLRPPYPAESGLWGRPTLVGNVETFTVVPWILRKGPEAFASLGTKTSTGTKVFALAGKVKRGGLIEVPMGVTIREIVEDIGGGVKDAGDASRPQRFKAVQIGGPSGGCVPAELADTPVDYEALAEVGAIMGSGGLVVLDETDCLVDIARYFLAFTQNQSCGQCAPCRIGTRRMLDILERLCNGEGRSDDLDKLESLAHSICRGSLCGLGQTAPNPVLTSLRYFRDEYEAHLEGRCPAGRCKALITYRVTDACIGCTLCAQRCPAEAIALTPYEKHEIDPDLCTRCDVCRVGCPEHAIEVV